MRFIDIDIITPTGKRKPFALNVEQVAMISVQSIVSGGHAMLNITGPTGDLIEGIRCEGLGAAKVCLRLLLGAIRNDKAATTLPTFPEPAE